MSKLRRKRSKENKKARIQLRPLRVLFPKAS